MFDHDQELEKKYHPENFEPMTDEELEKENEEENEAENEAIKTDCKKKLFKEIYGAMISGEYCGVLSEKEVADICLGVLILYKNKYLGYAKGVELSEI